MNKTVTGVLLCALALAACSTPLQANSKTPPLETSVCELAHAGQRLNGTRVSLTAISVTDLRHGSMLKDDKCPFAFVDVVISDKHQHDPDIEAFSNAILRDSTKNGLRVFNVKLSGVVVKKDASVVLMIDHIFRFSKNRIWPKSHSSDSGVPHKSR